MSVADIKKNTEQRMQKSIDAFKADLAKVRTGRAHAGLLDHVQVDYYGSMVPISQVANVGLADARTISVQPWEKKMVQAVEKAIRDADLGLNPSTMGEIIRVNRKPAFYDPVTGKQFYYTKRDDHKTTLMPQIPWLEPAIDGRRLGQMIHPTTNPRTLGKAASNGCIGLSEADAWRIYVYAPVGTKVRIRYDLEEVDPKTGDTLRYPDVYKWKTKNGVQPRASLAAWEKMPENICVCDSLF